MWEHAASASNAMSENANLAVTIGDAPIVVARAGCSSTTNGTRPMYFSY